MSRLLYFTSRAVSSLRHQVDKNLDWYYHGRGAIPEPDSGERPVRETHLAAVEVAERLELGEGRATSLDPKNAIAVHNALSELRPREAADERFWTHLCHTKCAVYIRQRWLTGPKDADDAARQVRNHFFARGNRSLVRDNALSRLWWLGYIAHEVEPDDPQLFLTILMHRQDIRSALIERPFLSMNHTVLKAIYAVMREHWGQNERNAKLFRRETFRHWMIRLNRRGGVILLDALPQKTLDGLLREEADEAIGGAGSL